jgi:hypothetical protein
MNGSTKESIKHVEKLTTKAQALAQTLLHDIIIAKLHATPRSGRVYTTTSHPSLVPIPVVYERMVPRREKVKQCPHHPFFYMGFPPESRPREKQGTKPTTTLSRKYIKH